MTTKTRINELAAKLTGLANDARATGTCAAPFGDYSREVLAHLETCASVQAREVPPCENASTFTIEPVTGCGHPQEPSCKRCARASCCGDPPGIPRIQCPDCQWAICAHCGRELPTHGN